MTLTFKFKVFWRLMLVALLASATVFILWQTPYFLAAFWTALFAVLGFWELIRFIDSEHREMRFFIEAIEQNDFSISMGNSRVVPKKYELKVLYDSLIDTYRRLRSEKESQHQFLQTLVEHIGVAILCYDSEGKIVLINRAAKDLLGKEHWYKLEALEKLDPELLRLLKAIPSGGQEAYTFVQNGSSRQLTLKATGFKLLGEAHKLIALQDISQEMETQELISWQKLIRVLTHEINNSVIPVATLSKLTLDLVESPSQDSFNMEPEDMEDLRGNLKVIADRSQGLARFVEEYKHFNSVSPLTRVSFTVQELFKRLKTLMEPQLEAQNIPLAIDLPSDDLFLWADLEKIEQVLINLIKNAIEAQQESVNPEIRLLGRAPIRGKIHIEVSDKGKGIPTELQDKIFTPFFTTRKKGSGIGLSLGRQIMNMHKGSLSLAANSVEGTTFRLVFERETKEMKN